MSRRHQKRGSRSRQSAHRGNREAVQSKNVLPSGETGRTTQDMDFEVSNQILKVDEELGLVLGWAIVSKIGGEPYFDTQGDHIPESSMLEAATDFMLNSRVAKEMHEGDQAGSVVFAWPMTADIAAAFGIETTKTGLMIAMRPEEEMLQKFKRGELKSFSIGGTRGTDEEVDE